LGGCGTDSRCGSSDERYAPREIKNDFLLWVGLLLMCFVTESTLFAEVTDLLGRVAK
jgi:hypothetical protein